MKNILIVDDNQDVLFSLKLLLKNTDYQIMTAKSPASAIETIKKNQIDIVLQDMNFNLDTTSGKEGLNLLKDIKEISNQMPVILFSAWANIDVVVEGMKIGASNFFVKPWDNNHLLKLINDTIKLSPQNQKASDLPSSFKNIIGESILLKKELETASLVSDTDVNILIRGENGTGKDLLAEAVHNSSNRGSKPFVKVNIAGLSSTLFDSEVFGHVKGAFTDARESRMGRFEEADGGTLFLDEIGDLALESQVKLLRVIQDGQFEKLGSSKTIKTNVRVIAATNKNLEEAIKEGHFREDLYYRLNTIEINLPALRDRGNDKLILAEYFLNKYNQKYKKQFVLDKSNKALILNHKWNGNIRELQHIMERSVLISKEMLSIDLKEVLIDTNLPEPGSMSLDEIEKNMIIKALRETGNHISKTAKLLGINRTSLYRRLEKYNIEIK